MEIARVPRASRPGRILVVDDDPVATDATRRALLDDGHEVVVATSGDQAILLAGNQRFDLAITELKLPGTGGLALQTWLSARHPQMPIVFLTAHGSMEDAIAALRLGRAADFLLKPLRASQLRHVVELTLGRVRELAAVHSPAAPPPEILALSPREREVVSLLVRGLDNAEIAARLVVSHQTVKNHLTSIYEKLNVHSRSQAIFFCHQHKVS